MRFPLLLHRDRSGWLNPWPLRCARISDMQNMRLSIVIPFYNEEEQVALTVAAVTETVAAIPDCESELILIDDGSTDSTWAKLEQAAASHPEIRLLGFSRNFGKEAALCAGLDAVTGDCAVVLDGDLQFPPRYIPEMVRLWREEGYEVVDGIKIERQSENPLARAAANTFYRIFRRASGINLRNASDFKLLDRRVVDAWRELDERETFFRGLSAWLGFRRIEMPFTVDDRTTGHSKWNVRALMRLSINAIAGFSSAPLHLIVAMGVVFWLLALVLGIQTLVMKLLGRAESGFTTVILLLLLIGGGIMIALGLIGSYIGKIYHEVKGRPRYLVSRTERGPLRRVAELDPPAPPTDDRPPLDPAGGADR